MFPNYIDELLKAYFEMSSEDRKKILNKRYFDTNPLTCPKEYLPCLALEVGVNIDGLSEEDTRAVIEKAIKANNIVGTAGCVKECLSVFGDVRIYEKENFVFDVDFSLLDREITNELYERSLKTIEKRKNVRSVLGEFLLSYKTSANLNLKVGTMGETRSEAEMIMEFTNSAVCFAYPYAGTMGEVVAVAEMTEV
ncbi:MAG: phage tail protein [Nautiliaceae bacterium]